MQLTKFKSSRSQLLNPGAGFLAQVFADQGERCYEAVERCLEGGAVLGIGEDEDDSIVLTEPKLQQAFMTHVVDALESICI